MYYICKFSQTWSVYDGVHHTSRNLEATEVHCLKTMFPSIVGENKILIALQVSSINPNRLLQLPMNAEKPAAKNETQSKT